jgi:hypothetical protein
MADPQAAQITLTPRQQFILEQILRRPTSPQGLVKGVRLILGATQGTNNTQLCVSTPATPNGNSTLSNDAFVEWRMRYLVVQSY